MYQYLNTQISSSKSARVHFAFIKAAAKQGHLKELERVCRESTVYDPHAVKRWLMEEANLSDQLPLVIVCDRHNLVHDLVTYLHSQGANRYIEVYVQRVNPARAADVIAALLDVGASEETVTALLAVVPAKYPLDALVQVLEERHRLALLRPYLEARIRAEPNSPAAHTALLKVLIESGAAREQAEAMLRENRLYEPLSVGVFCEQRGEPDLALMAYACGQCDAELLRVTSEHGLYRQQAAYLLKRRDAALWKHVLEVPSAGRAALLEQLVQQVGPESKEAEEVSACVKGLLGAGLHPELLALLERIVLQTPGHPFAGNKNLQNLLILTSIKHAPSRVREQLDRLQGYDGAEVSKAALSAGLAEEALMACRPQRLHAQAMEVLVGHLRDFGRAYQYAEQQGLPEVWARLGKGLLAQGMLKEAVDAYVRAEDASDWQEVVRVAHACKRYEDLARYLTMARTKLKDAGLETELLVALGVTNQIAEVEAALKHPNLANLATAAERCYEAQAWQAARLLFGHTANHARLAVCLLHLKDLAGAMEAARRANSPRVWAELVGACVSQGEWKLAQQAGIQLLSYAEEIDSLVYGYESQGHVEQLISLLEAAQINNSTATNASASVVCTELACLYARHRPAALMEHLTLHWSRLQPAKVVAACEEAHLWSELCFLHLHQDDLDRAVSVMIDHAETCWEAERMHKALARCVNPETLYRAIQFYREEHPLLLNEMLMLITPRIDPARVIEQFKAELPLIRAWMQAIQGSVHLQLLNQSLNELLLSECDAAGLLASFQRSDRFDTLAWATRLHQHGRKDMRRLAADLYRRNRRWSEALALLTQEGLWTEAIELACASADSQLISSLLKTLVDSRYGELYVLLLWRAGDQIPLDCALEGAWKAGWMDLTMPFICGSIRELTKAKKP